MTRARLSLCYSALPAVPMASAWLYLSSDAPVFIPEGGFPCRELQSSGGDDDSLILLLAVFVLPLLWRLLRPTRRPSNPEIVALAFALQAALLMLWLARLDCASLLASFHPSQAPLLSLSLFSMALSPFLLWRLRKG